METMNMPPGVGGIQPQYGPVPNMVPMPYRQPQYYQQPQTQYPMQRPVDPRSFETPEIVGSNTGKSMFTIIDEVNANPVQATKMTVPVETGAEVEEVKKRRGRPPLPRDSSGKIIRDGASSPEKMSGTVEETPTAYTYMETTGLLKETLGQIDSLNSELAQEFASVRSNKYLKNKYNVLIGLSENIGSLIGNRISAIREINASISKANDLDYKKLKDMKAAQAEVNDDAYIANLYQSFISNPQNLPPQLQAPPMDATMYGGNSGIVRANLTGDPTNGGQITDAGYMNYLSNMTPEQNLMRYENNPDVKQVVVYDASTGAKFFQMMNLATGEVIPNVPVYDQMFMDDTYIDVKNKIAKNNNLRETFPLVVINDNITSQY